jgi:hypothetical protein
MQSLGPELLLSIGSHLKPRHLYKLMQTSKTIKVAVDVEDYWARVAVHILFVRNYGFSEMFRLSVAAYDLVNLEHGYSKTMDEFVRMARVFMEKGPDENPGLPLVWKELANAPVKAIVMAGYDNARTGWYDATRARWIGDVGEYYNKSIAETSKDVVKIEVLFPDDEKCQMSHALDKFRNAFDDDNSLSKYQKAKIASMISPIMSIFLNSNPQTNSVDMEDLNKCIGSFRMEPLTHPLDSDL